MPAGSEGPGAVGLLAMALPVAALKAFLLLRAWQRRGWARIGLAVFTWLGIAAYMPGLVHAFRVAPAMGAADLVLVLAEAIAIVLLFLPASNRWYRPVAPTAAAP